MTYSLLLSCFVLVLPLIGKAINYSESLILYGGTIIFLIASLSSPSHRQLTKKTITAEIILVLLSLISTIHSKNIGYSYYATFNLIFSLIILNLCLKYLDPEKISKKILYFSIFYSCIFLLNKAHLIMLSIDPSFDNFILQVWGHSYLADFLIFPIPFLLYSLLNQKNLVKKERYFYILSLLFLLTTLILTNSRTAIVAITVSTIYIVSPKLKKYLQIPFITLLIATAVFFNYQLFSQNHYTKSIDGSRLEYWYEALVAFVKEPVFGNGPGNFFYINKKYQSIPFTNTNYAHNSLLEYLCLNGLPFAFIIFSGIILSLIYQSKKNSLNFAIGLTALVNSFFDPSWNSVGIFCLSFFFIFNQNPEYVVSTSTKKGTSKFQFFVLVLISLFFISKTNSDFFFIYRQNLASLYTDPFNLNPRLALLPSFKESTSFLYKNDLQSNRQLSQSLDYPQNEKYFFQIYSLSPKEATLNEYLNLANNYVASNNLENLDSLLKIAFQNLNVKILSQSENLSIAKIAYKQAIYQWNHNRHDQAIEDQKIALHFSQGWSHFHIELANMYWHNAQPEMARRQLNLECHKFPSSIKHCQDYVASHPKDLLPPGTEDFQKPIESL